MSALTPLAVVRVRMELVDAAKPRRGRRPARLRAALHDGEYRGPLRVGQDDWTGKPPSGETRTRRVLRAAKRAGCLGDLRVF